MLVLSRRVGEKIVIEPGIEISVVDVRGGKVRIGINAPIDVRILRGEVRPHREADCSHRHPATES
jgi:carbon storage regulator